MKPDECCLGCGQSNCHDNDCLTADLRSSPGLLTQLSLSFATYSTFKDFKSRFSKFLGITHLKIQTNK